MQKYFVFWLIRAGLECKAAWRSQEELLKLRVADHYSTGGKSPQRTLHQHQEEKDRQSDQPLSELPLEHEKVPKIQFRTLDLPQHRFKEGDSGPTASRENEEDAWPKHGLEEKDDYLRVDYYGAIRTESYEFR